MSTNENNEKHEELEKLRDEILELKQEIKVMQFSLYFVFSSIIILLLKVFM